MSDVAGTPLPTTGSTTQSSPNNTGYKSFIDGGGGDGWLDCNGDGVSSGSSTNDSNWNPVAATAHSPPFTGTTNGFQVTEGEYLETTATNICTKVMLPAPIQYWLEWNPFPTQPRGWWHGVSDESGNVQNNLFLELISASYVFEGYVPPHPHGGEQPMEGRPFYKVRITARVSTNYIVSFTSQETWTLGYMASAFRVAPTSSNPCQEYSSAAAVVVPVMPSLPTYLPATGSITQGGVGGGSIGFIAGGGGDGWNGCPGGTSGSSDDSNWNPVVATAHAPTFTSTTDGINFDGELPPGTYLVSYRHRVREIRASPANSTGPAYDAVQTYGWVSLGTTTDPAKWGVGSTTTANPSDHWPTSSTASPCITGNGYAGIICSCALDTVQEFLTYEGLPYSNPYLVTSFTSEKCIAPSIGNSAYKILTEGELKLKFERTSTPNLFTLPTTGSNSQSTCPNDGWLSFVDGGGGEGWMDCDGDGVSSGSAVNDSNWNTTNSTNSTNHPGGSAIDRTYQGDPSNALPAGGHNWEIKYTVHQIQYATVHCTSGAVTGQINNNSPDYYHTVNSSVSSQATAIRLLVNPSRTTSSGCSAAQGWNITSTVVPLTLEVTWTGSGASSTSQILSPPNSNSWDNGTLGGVYQSGNLTDNWITIIHVKRDGVIQ